MGFFLGSFCGVHTWETEYGVRTSWNNICHLLGGHWHKLMVDFQILILSDSSSMLNVRTSRTTSESPFWTMRLPGILKLKLLAWCLSLSKRKGGKENLSSSFKISVKGAVFQFPVNYLEIEVQKSEQWSGLRSCLCWRLEVNGNPCQCIIEWGLFMNMFYNPLNTTWKLISTP